jgi:pilus assembly protein Flp/PilA
MSIKSSLKRFLADESGASLAEYALLVGLIAVIAVGAVTALGTTVQAKFTDANTKLNP